MLVIECALVLVAIVLALACPTVGSHWFERVEARFARLARRRRLAVIMVGVAALSLRAALLPILPIPECAVTQVQWKYGYGLPDEPPDEFQVTTEEAGAAANDSAVLARYWQKLCDVWVISGVWHEQYEWNTIRAEAIATVRGSVAGEYDTENHGLVVIPDGACHSLRTQSRNCLEWT